MELRTFFDRALRASFHDLALRDDPASGYLADLLVVSGNPLENLKVLYPTGVDEIRDGKLVHTGGVEWTIKDGIPYYAPGLLADVKEIVAKARAGAK